MIRASLRGLSLFLLLFLSCHATAQYRFDNWNTKEGLPQNTISAITQTRDGYLWLATYDGLVRFDGVRFTIFDKSNSRSIQSNRLNSLYEDSAGALWIGTQLGGITRYINGEFKTFTTADGLPDSTVWQIQQDESGQLTAVTRQGVSCFDGTRFNPCLPSLPARSMNLYFGPSGARWVASPEKLERLKHGVTTDFSFRWRQSYPYTRQALEDKSGDLWIGVEGQTLYRVQGDQLTRYENNKQSIVPQNEKIEVFWTTTGEDSDGNIWFGQSGEGIVTVFNRRTGTMNSFGKAQGLNGNGVTCFFRDREGTLWLGTSNNGLYRVTKTFMRTYSTADGLVGNNVYPIYEDRLGQVWIGTDRGLDRFKDGSITNISGSAEFNLNGAQSIFEDRGQNMWLGFAGRACYLKNGVVNDQTDRLSQTTPNVIKQDRHGVIWFGTETGLLRMENQQITRVDLKLSPTLSAVRDIHEDRQGVLWVATNGGLVKITNNSIVTLTVTDGLVSDTVRTITEDDDGTLWVGTYDGGISRFKNGRFANFTTANGLFSNGAFRILEDGRGNFWISSNRGIYRVAKQQLIDVADGKAQTVTSIAYGSEDGMLNTECNGGRQPAGIKTRDGRLWFPTQQGVVVIDPDAVPFNPVPPPVVIETVKIENQVVPIKDGTVEVRPGQTNLEISYAGLSLLKGDQTRFKYQLSGLYPDWIDAGTRRTVYFSYLPPGTYTLTVIAANSDGVWNNNGQSIKLIVIAPFYRTWWFAALLAIGGIALAAVVYKIRVSQLEREKRRQEIFSRKLIDLQENERKRIAGELHDSLSQNLVIIKNRAMISLKEPDDPGQAFEQLEEIADAAGQSLSEVREIAYNLRPFQIDRLGLTKSIEALARKTSTPRLEVSTKLDNIDGVLIPEMEINLYRIVQEGLNNIIKHSEASNAAVEISRREKEVEIVIRDNGKGFQADSRRTESQNGGGFGLLGITERARILGCSPQIESQPGRGLTIALRIKTDRS